MCVPIISLMFYTLEAQVVSSTYQNPTDGELPLLLRSNLFLTQVARNQFFWKFVKLKLFQWKVKFMGSCVGMFFRCAHVTFWELEEFQGVRSALPFLPFHRWVFPCHLLDLLPLPLLLLIFFLRNQQALRFSVELFAKLGINKLQQKHHNSAKPPKAIGTLPAASCWKMALLRYAPPSAPPNLWRENPLLHPQQSIHPPFNFKKK